MTLVLLIGAGLLIHSFVRLTSVSPGFRSGGRDGVVQTVRVTLPERLADEPERIHAFCARRARSHPVLPGVTSASLINSMPFGRMFIQGDFDIEGQPKPSLFAGTPKIEPGYFKTMGIAAGGTRVHAPGHGGRDESGDRQRAHRARMLSRVGSGQALGRRVRVNVIDRGEWLTVVGVVADIRPMSLERDVQPMIYVPFQQDHSGLALRVGRAHRHARQGGRGHPASSPRRTRFADPEHGDDGRSGGGLGGQPRFRMVLLGLFAMTAMLIATCGLYGLMAYAVTQRRREIGAHGARRRTPRRAPASCSRARCESSSPAWSSASPERPA